MASSSIPQSISSIRSSLPPLTARAITAGLSLLTIPIAYWVYTDYQGWLTLGRGGLPYNFSGWLKQCMFRLYTSSDVRSTAMYDKMPAKSHLKGLLPERKGPRPGIGKWPVPHRQVDGFASKEMNETMQTHLVTLSESNLSHLSIQTSAYERRGPALWICQDPDGKTGNSDQPEKRELAHVHDSEGSSHVILSPKDAKEVIEKRWGERHGLSGVMVVPAGYLMIYGPKNEEELKAWKMIIAASVAYGGGGAGRGIEL